jgi:hypothetical protein
VVRCLVWLAAAVGIAFPQLLTQIALALSIGRGADLVLYLSVLAFLATSFYFYSRCVSLQRQMTQLVRHLAVREARRGAEDVNGTAREPEPVTDRPATRNE